MARSAKLPTIHSSRYNLLQDQPLRYLLLQLSAVTCKLTNKKFAMAHWLIRLVFYKTNPESSLPCVTLINLPFVALC